MALDTRADPEQSHSKWSAATIADVAEKVGMGPFGSSIKVETFVPEGIPIISGQHLHGSRLDDSPGYNFITEEHAKRLANASVRRGDIVFTHAGNIGQAAYIPDRSSYARYVISQRQFYMRCDRSKVIPEFVAAYFRSPEGRHKLLANASQVGVPAIAQPVSYLRTIEIPLPSLPEQRTIAHILCTLDDKIDLNRRMDKTLESMAQALFKSWFVDFEPVRAKMAGRDTGLPAEIEKMFPYALDVSGNPQGWVETPLAEIVSLVKGRSYRSTELLDSDVALVTLKSFQRGGGYRSAGLKPYTGAFRPDQVLNQGELIFALTDVTQAAEVIGVPAIVPEEDDYDTLVASLDVGIVRPSKCGVSTAFLYNLFLTDHFRAHIRGHCTGTTVLHLGKRALPSYLVSLPPHEILVAFNRVVEPLFRRRRWMLAESKTLTRLRDNLLPKLVSGDIRVQQAEKVVAEVP